MQVNDDVDSNANGRPETTQPRQFLVRGRPFELPARFQLAKVLQQSKEAVLVSAKDVHTDKDVAVKQVRNVANSGSRSKQELRAMRVMRHFQHANLMSLNHAYVGTSTNRSDCKHVYLVFDLVGIELGRVIASKHEFSAGEIKYIGYQILLALQQLHGASVIHGDLNPSKILINSHSGVKLCGFGRAKGACHYTEDAWSLSSSQWHRAPEALVEWTKCTPAVDVWSCASILADLVLKRPLFQGSDLIEQFEVMTDVIGSPSQEDIRAIEVHGTRQFVEENFMEKARKPMSEVFQGASHEFVDLMDKILVLDPSKRISAAESLRHPYFEDLHGRSTEVVEDVQEFSFEFDGKGVSLDVIKQALWDEIELYYE